MNGQSLGSAPILCAHLLRRVDEKLVELLGSLEPSEWDLQTMAPLWQLSSPLRDSRKATSFGSFGTLIKPGKKPTRVLYKGWPACVCEGPGTVPRSHIVALHTPLVTSTRRSFGVKMFTLLFARHQNIPPVI